MATGCQSTWSNFSLRRYKTRLAVFAVGLATAVLLLARLLTNASDATSLVTGDRVYFNMGDRWTVKSQHTLHCQPRRNVDSCADFLTCGKLGERDVWIPHGCTMRDFSPTDIEICLKIRQERNLSNTFVFNGDSEQRRRAVLFAKMLMGLPIDSAVPPLEFFKYANGSWYGSEVIFLDLGMLEESFPTSRFGSPPGLFLFGSNLWFAMPPECNPIREMNVSLPLEGRTAVFKQRLVDWAGNVTAMNWPEDTTKVVWVMQDLIYPGHADTTNRDKDIINDAALEVLASYPRIAIWKSGMDMADQMFRSGASRLMDDLTHPCAKVHWRQLNMILNLLCNQHIPSPENEKTTNWCCS